MMHTNNFHTVSAEDMRQMIDEAAASIRAKTNKQFRTFIVLGSGLGGLGELVENAVKISYGDIPHFAQSTVAGHKGQLIIGDLFGKPVMLMQGRFHFYEGHPLWQIAVPVRVARALGAENFIVTNAAGGINRTFKVADVMLITDQINLIGMAGNNPLIGPNDENIGPRFPAMTQTYD
ncbi:MAG TPA: purine-nucleoside phosphorylase, partial [Thermoflexales bacterium]|nr:purine-nucleoside phosphorylase [Thermoflexales bacterium]